ncbi:LLM class F420-dependent oxidoreductase [Dictyobacter alpinus]|uniref:LLM class F420-dependent oxidoreductase n=1 Tax=Dictyobacter alpinus TaxID=2014873 RepID=A0A402BGB8_9CHLR|nr:TIGR03621 family F420-dependent LLM class oxidoreductase [Dictyobacter alpinus]GCE30413.1 LLM class F420-dependent oxidoreductase [Dictyobacter alpinus]
MMQRPFRFGVVGGSAASREAWITYARLIEELGYSTLLLPDRAQMGLAPFASLSVAATATSSLRVGSYVFCNDYRHPAILAKEIATLDLLSDGRFEIGIGAGVGPMDYTQMGLPFESAGDRVGRVEETLTIIKQYFCQERVNFSGKYYTITDLPGLPHPVQQPHPPIFIGSAGKRLLSIAARQADIISPNLKYSPQGSGATDVSMAQKIDWLREAAGERFEQLELSQAVFNYVITDSPVKVARLVNGPPMPIQPTPLSTEQAIESLLKQREELGFSYIQVGENQLENFAPVVARLTGK